MIVLLFYQHSHYSFLQYITQSYSYFHQHYRQPTIMSIIYNQYSYSNFLHFLYTCFKPLSHYLYQFYYSSSTTSHYKQEEGGATPHPLDVETELVVNTGVEIRDTMFTALEKQQIIIIDKQ